MNQLIIPTLVAFVITTIIGPFLIPFLRRLKAGQTEREELSSHQKKNGTPTMGGLMILAGIVLTSLFYVKGNETLVAVLLVTLAFGVIGFLDDYLKVVKKHSDGLLPWQKMLCQIVVTLAFLVYLVLSEKTNLSMLIPFTGGFSEGIYLKLGFLALPILFLAILGTVNGANFTDGLDGLGAGVTVMIAGFFIVASYMKGGELTPLACAVTGALIAFLLFNAYPARVFMGDTGSLALGGFVSAMACVMNLTIFILIVALIYWIEILSVMIQVAYFKKTGGKRLFKMAPIHHHFELSGWQETRVVALFAISTFILCLIALLAL